MSIFDKIDHCICGYEFNKGEEVCPKCGRVKYRMSLLPKKDDSVDSTLKGMAKAKEFAKKILFFQLARNKTGGIR